MLYCIVSLNNLSYFITISIITHQNADIVFDKICYLDLNLKYDFASTRLVRATVPAKSEISIVTSPRQSAMPCLFTTTPSSIIRRVEIITSFTIVLCSITPSFPSVQLNTIEPNPIKHLSPNVHGPCTIPPCASELFLPTTTAEPQEHVSR